MRRLLALAVLLCLLWLALQNHAHAASPCGHGAPGTGTAYQAAPGLCAATAPYPDGHVGLAAWAAQGDHVVIAVWRRGSERRAMAEFGPPVALRQGETRQWFFVAVAPTGAGWRPDVAEVRRVWLPLVPS